MLAALTLPAMAMGAAANNAPIFVTQFENDLFAGQDQGYTNGMSFSIIPDRSETPGPVADLIRPLSSMAGTDNAMPYSLSLEQLIFTPQDITDPAFPPEDRPYAGWLNLTTSSFVIDDNRLERWQLGIGVVGPASLAEQSQKSVHSVTGADEPVGWDSQLPNEPTLQLGWDRQWRLPYQTDGLLIEVAPTVGVTVGNAVTGAEAGGFIRVGNNIPVDFGPPRLRSLAGGSGLFIPEEGFGWYVYAGVSAQVTAHEIFLDGSLFQDTASVDRDPHRGQAYFGFACYHGPTRIAFTQVVESASFDAERGTSRFGAVSLSWRL
jgi:hypothetical protein